jgi:hypothetical protein
MRCKLVDRTIVGLAEPADLEVNDHQAVELTRADQQGHAEPGVVQPPLPLGIVTIAGNGGPLLGLAQGFTPGQGGGPLGLRP